MEQKFEEYISVVKEKFKELQACPCYSYPLKKAPVPDKGVYLLSEAGKPLYVGRSNTIRRRLGQHQRKASGMNMASFAAQIAREICGVKREYGHRRLRIPNPRLKDEFKKAKERVGKMDIRFVREEHGTRQALLEIYAATVLDTPYNDFGNH